MIENVITDEKGNYILILSLKKAQGLFVPRFGMIQFSTGIFLYCGSAHGHGGLKSRVARHLKNNTKPHWHIDWVKERMEILEVWSQISEENNECVFSNFIAYQENAAPAVIGFGSSDCKNKCQTHFWKFPLEENVEDLFSKLISQYEGIMRFFP